MIHCFSTTAEISLTTASIQKSSKRELEWYRNKQDRAEWGRGGGGGGGGEIHTITYKGCKDLMILQGKSFFKDTQWTATETKQKQSKPFSMQLHQIQSNK